MFGPLKLLLDRFVVEGNLTVIDAEGRRHAFGDGKGVPVAFSIADKKTERRRTFDPTLAFGDAYMDGRVNVLEGSIYDLIATFMRNEDARRMPLLAQLPNAIRYAGRRIQQFNPVSRAQKNVAHHYDISGAIYDLFLDTDRQYSCAYFETDDADLETAQQAKKRHLASKLRLEPGQRVLDIGSGWGGLAIYLARTCGVHVTGITLSQEQLTLSQERARRYDGPGSVAFKLLDYREIEGTFDRIVSVGMFEHVGVNHYRTYFRRVADLLAPDGIALIHTIGRLDTPSVTNPFTAKYIFPGGYIPALSEVMNGLEPSRLFLTDVEILRLHYAKTLRHWRERFTAQWDRAAQILDERFCRMWEFYLAGAEAAFRFERLAVFQLQIAKQVDTLPITRTYMIEEEERLRRLEVEAPERRLLAGE